METRVRGPLLKGAITRQQNQTDPVWQVPSQGMKQVGLPHSDLCPISRSTKNGFNHNLAFPLS